MTQDLRIVYKYNYMLVSLTLVLICAESYSGESGRGSLAPLSAERDRPAFASLSEDLLVMEKSLDAATGAVITGHTPVGGLPFDALRESVWVAYAWDLAHMPDRAQKHARFCLDLIRRTDNPGRPAGSWPVLVLADGAEVLPDTILDPGVGAWVLSFFWRHARCLPEVERYEFLASCWPATESTVDFLVRWVDSRNRQPLAGFDANRWRDTVDDMTFLEHYMGVDAGLRIAAAVNKKPTEAWTRRKRELDALIRFHCVGRGGEWISPAILPFWQDEFRETALPSWAKAAGERVFSPISGQLPDAKEVCNAALAFRDDVGQLNALKPLACTPERHGSLGVYEAALHFIAIATIYGDADAVFHVEQSGEALHFNDVVSRLKDALFATPCDSIHPPQVPRETSAPESSPDSETGR